MASLKSLNKRFGAAIAERDLGGWMCAYCYKTLDPTHAALVRLESSRVSDGSTEVRLAFYLDAPCIDHVVAEARGGPTHIDNLVLSCRACNGRKYAHAL